MAGGIEFNSGRFKELVLLLTERSRDDPRMSRVKLNKLLYYIDFEAFRTLGESVTGATYLKGEHGPMAKELPLTETELGRRGHLSYKTDTSGRHPRKIPVAIEKADEGQFTEPQLELVEKALADLREYGGWDAREWSHEESVGWNEVQEQKGEIPYHSTFFSMDQIPDEDIERARQLAIERNWAAIHP